MEAAVPARLTAAEGRRFGFVVGGAFLALATLLWWRGHVPAALVAGVPGGTLVVAALAVPTWLGPVQRGWMGFALMLSKVTTPIFMGIVFYLVMTPIGLIARGFGHNPIATRRGPSTWVKRHGEEGRRSRLERQF